jgi:hypothetical protein
MRAPCWGAERRARPCGLYLRSVDVLRAAGSPRALLVASADVAHVLQSSKLLEQALPFYREAIDALDYLFAQTRGLEEQARYAFLGQYSYLYRHLIELLLELHAKQPRAGRDRQALAVSSRNQSRIFTELPRQADVAKFVRDPAFVALKREHGDLAQQIAALKATRASIPAAEGEAARRPANIAAAGAELEKQLAANGARLGREFLRFMELAQSRPVAGEELQGLLKPGETLLNFVLLPEATAVFAVTRERIALYVRPVKQAEIIRRNAAVRAAVGSADVLRRLDPAHLNYLYQELIAPAAELLQGRGRVLVVGDGLLYDAGSHRESGSERGTRRSVGLQHRGRGLGHLGR